MISCFRIIKVNEIVRSLLAGDKLMPEMHLKMLDLLIVPVGRLLKIKKKFKHLKKQDIQNKVTEMN